jgi:hypothetical protein
MSGRAVLWRKRHKGWKVRALAAWAASIGMIVALCVMPDRGVSFPAEEKRETKICCPFLIEHVEIPHSSVEVKYPIPPDDSPHLSYRHFSLPDHRMKTMLFRADIADAAADLEWQGIVKTVRNSWRYNPHIGDNTNVLRGGISVIDNNWPEFESEIAFLLNNEAALNGDIGPKLAFSGILSKQFLDFARPPKLVGGEPKADGGYSQNNSESSNHALVVVLKEGINALENERRSHVEGGAIFFIIVIGGLLTVLWLYQTKR